MLLLFPTPCPEVAVILRWLSPNAAFLTANISSACCHVKCCPFMNGSRLFWGRRPHIYSINRNGSFCILMNKSISLSLNAIMSILILKIIIFSQGACIFILRGVGWTIPPCGVGGVLITHITLPPPHTPINSTVQERLYLGLFVFNFAQCILCQCRLLPILFHVYYFVIGFAKPLLGFIEQRGKWKLHCGIDFKPIAVDFWL